jgi:hypothetical protein
VSGGIFHRGRGGFLVGVFLSARWGEGTPPTTLDFGGRYDFDRLAPALGQLFFIGDGRVNEPRPPLEQRLRIEPSSEERGMPR